MPLKKSHRAQAVRNDAAKKSLLPQFSFEQRPKNAPVFCCFHDNLEAGSVEDALVDGHNDDELVTWDGPDDPQNPLNWSKRRKWLATILVSSFTFISGFATTMITPVLEDIADDYDIPEDGGFARQLIMSIFLLGYAQGPFVLAPLSELFGRVRVLQISSLVFLVFNTLCPCAQTATQLYVFRLLSGIGGSAPQAVCSGVLADCWRKEERGLGQSIYGILTFISPAVAPIVGAYVADDDGGLHWSWIFWGLSIADFLLQVLAFMGLRETYAPKILEDKAKKLRKATSKPWLRTEYASKRSTASIVRRRLVLPWVIMLTHPAAIATSVYRAFLYGINYLVLSTFQEVWEDNYDLSTREASLHYLAIGLGSVIGLQISHLLIDKLYAYLKEANDTEQGVPEWRIPPMLLGGVLAPAGLLIYGWCAEEEVHWAVTDLGVVILSIGIIITFQSAQAYITDTYNHQYAASAAAAGAFLRTMAGFSFPLFATSLYERMDVGWGNTMLAGLTLLLAVPAPIALWFFGAKMRAWSRTGLD